MSDWAGKMANEFKKRNNQSTLGFLTGIVVSENPLKISVLSGQVIIDKGYKFENATFEVGDNVVLMATGDNQSFFVAGKCEKFGE